MDKNLLETINLFSKRQLKRNLVHVIKIRACQLLPFDVYVKQKLSINSVFAE